MQPQGMSTYRCYVCVFVMLVCLSDHSQEVYRGKMGHIIPGLLVLMLVLITILHLSQSDNEVEYFLHSIKCSQY